MEAEQAKPAQTATPAEAVFRSFLRTIGLFRRIMDPYFAQFGISGPQWAILRVLQRAEEADGPGGLPLSELGQRLLIQPPSVTGVVDRLERQGLVKRSASQDDRRVRYVRLTPKARALVAEVLRHHAGQIRLLFAGLGSAEMGDLLKLLARLEAHLQTLVPGAKPRAAEPAGSPARH